MRKLIRFLKEGWLSWKYRHVDKDVCCCGSYVSKGGWGCPAPCRSMKEYVITKELGEG